MWIEWGWIMGAGMSNDELMRACGTADELWNWVDRHAGVQVPRMAVCEGHDAPFEYLKAAYFEPAKDLVVWAPRGGGKTFLAAVATALDLLHKPGCGVRILGGSLDQSLRMWEHLEPMMMELAEGQIKGRATAKRLELLNGASVGVLTQSQRAVRGLRIQKLRCDEVEMFDPRVWEAAQYVTRSGGRRNRQAKACTPNGQAIACASNDGVMNHILRACTPNDGVMNHTLRACAANGEAAGVVEAISTLHESGGVMEKIVDAAYGAGRRVIRWCLLEVLEACSAERECGCCALAEECRGVAKSRCSGFVRIDDAIAMKHRVSQESWETEILCRRPNTQLRVFPTFDPAIHVRETVDSPTASRLSASVDFGFKGGFALLWVRRYEDGVVHVIDERFMRCVPLHEHIEYLKRRPWGAFNTITCDPAGQGVNDQTGVSNVKLLRLAGFEVMCRSGHIAPGLELIRAGLRPAAGGVKLFIHPRCARLVEAMRKYSYLREGGETPFKDGEHDHPVDALRYYYVNTIHAGLVKVRSY